MVARGTINYVSRETIPQNQCDSAGLARFCCTWNEVLCYI
jgi:hypothetical protein